MFRRKRELQMCTSCERPIRGTPKVCGECGAATQHMDFAERTNYEVQQWRRYQERAATG